MILAILALTALTATFQPASPTVGDVVTIDFPSRVTLNPSKDYEIVDTQGNRVRVRSFSPKPVMLSGIAGEQKFKNLALPMKSVLKKNDDMKPAPLVPPRPVPYPREPFIAIGIAAALAAIAWIAAWLLGRRKAEVIEAPAIPADERFRRAVDSLRKGSTTKRWAALADATRIYLAATRPRLGAELTTSELLPLLRDDEQIVAQILRQGDLEKFSPWGAEARDFDAMAQDALRLIPPDEVEEAA
jgi:hypothetical protein